MASKGGSPEGRKIRRLRMKEGISQEALAHQIGVTTHTIWRLENSATFSPRLMTLRAIAKALKVDLSDLLKN
jgi:transcriptional regulator with XRE-family HTH domain